MKGPSSLFVSRSESAQRVLNVRRSAALPASIQRELRAIAQPVKRKVRVVMAKAPRRPACGSARHRMERRCNVSSLIRSDSMSREEP